MAGLRRFRADWVLPISSPPIHRGWLAVEDGRIVDVGEGEGDAIDLGQVALLPGLVNAHTHLELSYLRGRVGRATALPDWVRQQLALRREAPTAEPMRIAAEAAVALAEARASGTILFGDVANSLTTVPVLGQAGVHARVFLELLGFSAPDPAERVREARALAVSASEHYPSVTVSLAPHAPYSVSPALFRELRVDLDRESGDVSSVHLGESSEELEFLARGTGAWKTILTELGAWNDAWTPPGVSPVSYLDDLGFLDARVLVVHGVQFTGEDLRRLHALDATLVSCPRSNEYVGVGAPPLEAFYAMGVNVALGTDSLASVDSLSMFDELAAARRLAPRVPASALLESATRVGACALGFAEDFGTLEEGRRADILSVRVPGGVDDVEEYLVAGIHASDITWVEP